MAKRPKLRKGQQGNTLKGSNENPPIGSQKLPPVFSFEKIQKSHCITDCEKDDKVAFIGQLVRLSKLRWQDINESSRKGLGTEIISRSSFKASIPSWLTDDTKLLSFRYLGNRAFIGYRDQRIFYVLWIDSKFDVYDHGS